MKNEENVEYIEQEAFMTASAPWHTDRIDQRLPPLDSIFEPKGTGAGVDIYILDTGMSPGILAVTALHT